MQRNAIASPGQKKLEAKIAISTILRKIGNPDGTGIADKKLVKYLHTLRDKWVPAETEIDGMNDKLRILKTISRRIKGKARQKNRVFEMQPQDFGSF